MKQITKNNILQEIREMREKKISRFKELAAEPLSSEYLVGTKHGIEITCRALEKIIKGY